MQNRVTRCKTKQRTVTMKTQQIKRRTRKRRGAAVVEFALVVPVMLTFTFGMIELSRINMIKEAIVQASREGARVGIRPTATVADVNERVDEELAMMAISTANVQVTPGSLDDAMPGDQVVVRISVPITDVSYVPGFFSFEGMDIIAETVMRRESSG